MIEIPKGVRFLPTDEQLVGIYLYKNITGTLPPSHRFIVKDHDLYGQEEPWEIWGRFWGANHFVEDLYFFTLLKKKSANGCRIDRRTGSTAGYWHRVNSGSTIEVDDYVKEEYTASKKTFVYRNPTSDEHHLWLMDEYRLELKGQRSENVDCVLCGLRRIGVGDSSYSGSGEFVGCDCAVCRRRRFCDDEDDLLDICLPQIYVCRRRTGFGIKDWEAEKQSCFPTLDPPKSRRWVISYVAVFKLASLL